MKENNIMSKDTYYMIEAFGSINQVNLEMLEKLCPIKVVCIKAPHLKFNF